MTEGPMSAMGQASGGHVAVVVVNYGSTSMIAENLDALRGEAEVIVVDNFSTTAERERAGDLCAARDWQFIPLPVNAGFGSGANRGAERALQRGAGQILFLNPDASITPAALSVLRDSMRRDPRTVVSPRIIRPDGRVWFDGMIVDLRDGAVRRSSSSATRSMRPWLSGACMMWSADAWIAAGGFDEEYFLYWEDVDLSVRALTAGLDLRVLPQAQAVHAVGATQDGAKGAKSALYYEYNIRNRLLFASRHLSAPGIERWLATNRAAAKEVLLRGGRRQFVAPWIPIRAAVRGSRAGKMIARERLESLRASE